MLATELAGLGMRQAIVYLLSGLCCLHAADVKVTVDLAKRGPRISPTMWGIFFEDINFGADGGLYAEMVKNRGFEFPDALMGWWVISPSLAKGSVAVLETDPADLDNPHYLRIRSEGTAIYGVANEGFRGMGFRSNQAYRLSFYVRRVEGNPTLLVELVANDGVVLAWHRFQDLPRQWEQHTVELVPTETDSRGRLNILVEGRGVIDIDFVSLFPTNTWKGRPGGLRADLVLALADLKPGFLRFPGGCIVEGSHLDRRYQWKKTIGPVTKRRLLVNRWNYEFKHRPTPDYYQTFGLGFFEYFQLAEDLHAEPLPILNCGMACQFNSGELCPLDELDEYIQDALDLIEFANGSITSKWGAIRAQLGHPEPFNLKMLGIGNEQWGPQYIERYERFARVIKERYPEIKLVAAAGPAPADERFQFLWEKLLPLRPDIIDEHCYARPIWFLAQFHRYDTYDRNGPKVFMGEFAAQSVAIASPRNKNTLECALAEAAYMLGMERNADVVTMVSYAPLFAHVDAWQWTPNLIWFDNLKVLRTANYYVQKLFGHNKGDVVLVVNSDCKPMQIERAGLVGLGTFSTAAEFKDIVVRSGATVLFDSRAASEIPGNLKDPWGFAHGILAQVNPRGTQVLWFGMTNWTNYSISFSVKKTSGREGFAVYLYRDPSTDSHLLWNVGGWTNSRHGLIDVLGSQDHFLCAVPGSIRAGQWYKAEVQLKGSKVECYLNGNLVQTAELPQRKVFPLYCSATLDQRNTEVILKLVNPWPNQRTAKVSLANVAKVGPTARLFVLTGDGPTAMNTFENPEAVSVRESTIQVGTPEFTLVVPSYSFVVARIPVE